VRELHLGEESQLFKVQQLRWFEANRNRATTPDQGKFIGKKKSTVCMDFSESGI
jgi:hypothetical protein